MPGGVSDTAAVKPGYKLHFRNFDGEPFNSQVFINDDIMHVRDTQRPDDFLLFNRKTQTIYSLSSADQTVFVIKPKPVVGESPVTLVLVEEEQPSQAIPKVVGKSATHYKYVVNGVSCYDAVVIPDFLPEAVAAMKEFRLVLAGEHVAALPKMPLDTLNPCDLALQMFHSSAFLDRGFPFREWDSNGKGRFLDGFQSGETLSIEEVTIPPHYRQYSIEPAAK